MHAGSTASKMETHYYLRDPANNSDLTFHHSYFHHIGAKNHRSTMRKEAFYLL
jgi:hypothetical protein